MTKGCIPTPTPKSKRGNRDRHAHHDGPSYLPNFVANDSGDTVTFSLSGRDADKFTIGASTGQVQTKSGGQYDDTDQRTYTFYVNATDSGGLTSNAIVSVLVRRDPDSVPSNGITDLRATAPAGSSGGIEVAWSPVQWTYDC